jgi:hypothetical protein
LFYFIYLRPRDRAEEFCQAKQIILTNSRYMEWRGTFLLGWMRIGHFFDHDHDELIGAVLMQAAAYPVEPWED